MKINRKFTRIMGVGLSAAMLASTVLTAVPVFADVSSATVSVTPATVSIGGNYTITFNVNGSVAATGNITIAFPATTVTTNASLVSNITVQSTAGFGIANLETTLSAGNASVASNGRTVTINVSGLTNPIGEASTVRIKFINGAITNPSANGTYSLDVSTSNDTTAITSQSYSISLPTLLPVPGKVTGKNSNGDPLVQNVTASLAYIISYPGVTRVELEAGTYNATNTASIIGQTIVGVGATGTVILTAPAASVPLTVTAVNVTLENLTIQGNINGTADVLSITANNTTVKNVTFIGGVNQVNATFTATSNRTTLSDCIFNVTGNVTSGVTTNGRVTTNSTFNVDNGGVGITASNGGLTATSAKFNGATGNGSGIVISGNGSSTITSCTFTNLGNNALVSSGLAWVSSNVSGSTVNVATSTFTGSGNTTATSATTDGVVTATSGDLILVNNTISNSAAAAYGLYVSGGNVTARFNTIQNTLNVKQTSGIADAANNWWGTAAAPGSSSISGTVITTPFLGGVTSDATVVFNSANMSGGTAGALPSGVEVSSLNATSGATLVMGTVAAAKYAANPQTTAPIGTPVAYYDVYVANPVDGATITIKFYNANINADSKVYNGGGLTGAWTLVSSQGVNANAGFVFVTLTGATSPGIADLDGTPFVVTNVISAPAAPTLLGPAAGTTGIPVNTGFSWSPVTGATSYKFQVSTDPGFASFAAGGDQTVTSTVAGGVTLATNTTYFWRVQAVNSGGSSAWSSSTFTTVAPAAAAPPVITPPPAVTVNVTPTAPVVNIAPAQVTVQPPNVTVNPPQVTVTAPPPANVTVNPPQVTISPPPPAQVTVNNTPPAPVIPTYILWTIILIGAVLIIALIVLIVRTRRVA